ncbi:hypothetical protein EF721_04980 [Salmonella enterica]|nr:hypothetical protein [Salmonella enterica]
MLLQIPVLERNVVVFAKVRKTLHRLQNPPKAGTPLTSRDGGMVCTKILLQNFYDPNTAGGCGVAPFPSRSRFRP